MNKIKSNLNLIVAVLTFVFIGFFVYNTFLKSGDEAGIKEIQVAEQSQDVRKIISLLNDIEKINFDTKFFTASHDPNSYSLTFNELQDFSQAIPNKIPGKINPFLKGGAADYTVSSETSDNTIMESEVDNRVQEKLVNENNQTENNATTETPAPTETTQ